MTKRVWSLAKRDTGVPVSEVPASAFSRLFGVSAENRSLPVRFAMLAIAVFFIAFVPAKVIAYAVRDSRPWAEVYHLPRANEPELMQFLSQNVSSQVGQPLRGSIDFWDVNFEMDATLANVWMHGFHTINEYSQLVTPQAIYFLHAVVRGGVVDMLNRFVVYPGNSWHTFARVMQL